MGPRCLTCMDPLWPLANSVCVSCGPLKKGPLGHPHGAHLWPVWTARMGHRWIHGGDQMGPKCITHMGPLWPPDQFCLGPMWASIKSPLDHAYVAHLWPVWTARVGPRRVPGVAQMVPRVSPIWAPCAPPLANSVWVPCGPPIKGPMGHPHGSNLWPVWNARVRPRWVHGGAQMGPKYIAHMTPCGPHGQLCLGPIWVAHKDPFGPTSWGPPVARMDCPCGAQMG